MRLERWRVSGSHRQKFEAMRAQPSSSQVAVGWAVVAYRQAAKALEPGEG